MKKTIIIVATVILIGTCSRAAYAASYNALAYHIDPPVYQYYPDNQNPSTTFNNPSEVNVYKFTDAGATCYLALSSQKQYSNENETLAPAISCVK